MKRSDPFLHILTSLAVTLGFGCGWLGARWTEEPKVERVEIEPHFSEDQIPVRFEDVTYLCHGEAGKEIVLSGCVVQP